jgi:ribosomal protein L17
LAIKTTLAQLEEVQTAITKILEGGQDVSHSDKRIMYAQLKQLQTREDILLKRYYAESGSGGSARNIGILRRTN